jgi:hypothetical protein
MEKCPTCGQAIQLLHREAEVLSLLRGPPMREIYAAQDGHWHITFGKGRVHASVVSALVAKGVVRPVYDDCSDYYGLGPTLDVKATLEARKRSGNKKQRVYLD